MSKKEKLIARLLNKPKNFTFEELTALLNCFDYQQVSVGKTGGSRVSFANDGNDYIRLHKPHPRNILKPYQLDDIINALKERNLL